MNMDSRTPQLISSEGQEGAGILTHPETAEPGSSDADYRVILYNDDWHGIDEVVGQVKPSASPRKRTCAAVPCVCGETAPAVRKPPEFCARSASSAKWIAIKDVRASVG